MHIKVPNFIYKNNYFWYICRCFYILQKEGKITLEITNDKFLYTHYIAIIFIDNQPCIFDLRDDSALPLPELKLYPNALIFKANYSCELWDNPPVTFEYPIKEEERQYRSQIRPFIFGRALNLDYNINEVEYYKQFIQDIKYQIVSYTGAGVFAQQTQSRLKVYDYISEMYENTNLVWFDRKHFQEADKIPNYQAWINHYKGKESSSWGSYESHIKFISQGKYSLNFPGIACSQPFRLVDAVLANRCILSTKIWIDIYKKFPCIEFPFCGYFGTGDFSLWKPEEIINYEQIFGINHYNTMLSVAKLWYTVHLNANGMWENQILKGLHQ